MNCWKSFQEYLILVVNSDIRGGGGGVNYPIPECIRKDRIILLSEISSAAEFINELGDK